MRYLLLMYGGLGEPAEAPAAAGTGPEAQDDGPAADPAEPCWEPWDKQLAALGVTHDGAQLQPVSTALTVRRRGAEVLVSDGPFAETKEYIAGFEVIECPDLETAIQAASLHPIAPYGLVEVRPIQDP
jgi:hypothetical protein